MRKIVLLAMLAGSINTAQASLNGNDLYEGALAKDRIDDKRSASPEDAMQAGVFMGYVMSSGDYTQGLDYVCYPRDTTNAQKFDIVFNYLKAHPEKRTDSAALITFNALHDVYPCKSKKQG